MNIKRIIANLNGKMTGYDAVISIHAGVNARTKEEALEKAELIGQVIEIKLGDYLTRFPSSVEVKVK